MNIAIQPVKGTISNVESMINTLEELGKKNKLMIQIVKADLIFSKLHIISALEHAIRSFKHDDNATSELGLELLLYLAGERQIHKAITKVGITDITNDFIIIFLSDLKEIKEYNGKLSNTIIDSVLEITKLSQKNDEISGDKNTLIQLGITLKEIDAVNKDQYEKLILEKIAMVDIIK